MLHLVEPLAVGVDDPLRKPCVEPKCGLATREAGCAFLRVDALALEHVEVFAQCIKALEQFPPIGVLRGQQAPDRAGPESAVALVSSLPGGFAAFVREAGTPALRPELPALDGPPDVERLARIVAAHGITLLGPPGILPSERHRRVDKDALTPFI